MGIAICCDICVSFVYLKCGNLLLNGYAHSKNVFLSSLSMPFKCLDRLADKYLLSTVYLNAPLALPARDPLGHKGTFGQTLFISGAHSYHGAPYLCTTGFLKTGGGYARLSAPDTACLSVAINSPTVVLHPYSENPDPGLPDGYTHLIEKIMTQQSCIVIGPGLSLSKAARELFTVALRANCPLIIDGDGLTMLAENINFLQCRENLPTVITPHAGEFSRLSGLSPTELNENPVENTQEFASEWGITIVFKGARTIIASPDGRTWINTTGGHGMATAGTGDILTGVIAALLSPSNLPVSDAVRLAVYIHGMAGDIAQKDIGCDGMIATDILDYLPKAMKLYRERYPEANKEYLPYNIQRI